MSNDIGQYKGYCDLSIDSKMFVDFDAGSCLCVASRLTCFNHPEAKQVSNLNKYVEILF